MINQEEYEILKDLDDRLGWLARDRDGDLVAYEKKPEKSTRFWFDNGWMVNLGVIFDVGRLFQFIQWEDEEPYLISDLINEHEKSQVYEIFNRQLEILYEESEEIEVKKDKDWLSEQVGDLNSTDAVFYESGVSYIDTAVSIERVFDLIYQLDEPEVLSQKLPEIPKFVADWIEDLKSKEINMLESIYDFTHGEDINDYMREQSNVLMRAWLDGYTMESEQKYYVLDTEDIPMLVITHRGVNRAYTQLSIHEKGRNTEHYQLTEQEIKDYDERFWAFAVPVEELTND